MPDETIMETTCPDTQSAQESLLGDVVDDAPAATDEEQDTQAAASAEDEYDTEVPTNAPEDLKIVVSIKEGRATIGVQQPKSDPHIETFDGQDLSRLAQEFAAVTERARARWEETPKYPAYSRPAPTSRRRSRRRQGAGQGTTAETETENRQQQTLRLF